MSEPDTDVGLDCGAGMNFDDAKLVLVLVMDFLLKYAPLLNMALILAGAFVVVSRVNDAVKEVKLTVHDLVEKVNSMDLRLTKQETICVLRHQEGGGD